MRSARGKSDASVSTSTVAAKSSNRQLSLDHDRATVSAIASAYERADSRAMALLDDKVVLVNGGTQGVGAGVARAAVREGATVAVTGRRPEIGRALVEALESGGTGGARYVQADLSDVEQVLAAAAHVIEAEGRVDCLVNSAGLTTRGTLLDTTRELFDAHIAINLRAPFFAMQAVVA